MGKKDLKKQHTDINYSVIDILYEMDKTGKMVPFLIKNIKNSLKSGKYGVKSGLLLEKQTVVQKYDNFLQKVLTDVIKNNFFGTKNIESLNRFTDHLENNRISQTDITKYQTWEDVLKEVTNADIKLMEKELKTSVKKVVETDDWLMVRPLSFEASLKYGANTKWCTASKGNKSYFYSYCEQGVLIYIIDKSKGIKYGVCNRPLIGESVSVWDEKDRQIDSCMMDLPIDLYMVMVEELGDKPNKEYFSETELEYYDMKKGVAVVMNNEVGEEYYMEQDSELEMDYVNDEPEMMDEIVAQYINDNLTNNIMEVHNDYDNEEIMGESDTNN